MQKRQDFTDIAKTGSSTSKTNLTSTASNVYEERLTAKKSKQHLTKATFEKWKQTYKHKYQMVSMVKLTSDSTMVKSLFCEVCKKYDDNI